MDYQKGDLETHQALSAVWELMGACDKYIDNSAPWTLKKNNQIERLKQVLFNLVNALRIVGLWVSPFMPQTSEKIHQQLLLSLPKAFEKNENWESFSGPHQLGESSPLFPRFEVKEP